MAITGIDTIEGKQIIAAGAVSAKSAEMAYNDENGNPITGYQVAGDYLTTADSANFYTTANESGFITGVDLTPYQLTADMTAYQPVGDYLTTADSANFYTTANESGFISEVPAGTMNESAFEYDENDKISGYNGSAFAGGSDVPEGVMVESGLEYNAVNEISGYNGSAIAQYGAEKQWLVHDDTLVHAANSAQYALGVNLSAVAQLLGVDETVLFESANAVTNAPLSESMTAFNRVRVSLANDFTDTGLYQTVIDLDVEHGSHVWEPVGGLGITNMWVGVNMLSANTDYTVLTAPKAKLINFGNWTTQGATIVGSTTGANVNVILKVIGIGRKEV